MDLIEFRVNAGADEETHIVTIVGEVASLEEALALLEATQGRLGAAPTAQVVEQAPKEEAKPKATRAPRAKAEAPKAEPEKAPVPEASAAKPEPEKPKPEPEKTNGAARAVEAPAELVAATSFRQVMNWMMENGYKDVESIAAKCEELRGSVPAIARLGGDLKERIGRALEVLSMERAQA